MNFDTTHAFHLPSFPEDLPLTGKTIVVTRAESQSQSFCQQLSAYGASVLKVPTIQIVSTNNTRPIQAALARLHHYDWVIFTSTNGVEHTLKRLSEFNLSTAMLKTCQIAAVGSATAEALHQNQIHVDLQPDEHVAEALVKALEERHAISGQRFLLLRSRIARQTLPQGLTQAGGKVDDIAVYDTIGAPIGEAVLHLIEQLKQQRVDLITFTSASTVTHFHRLMTPALQECPTLLQNVRLACIGPITRQTLIATFGCVDIEANPYTTSGLLSAILQYYQQAQK